MNDNLNQKEAEGIVAKIKKLMALSKSSNENEAAAAAAKAQELLLKYNVEISDLADTKTETHLVKEFYQMFDRNEIHWKKNLAWAIADANLCRGVGSGTGMYFLGKKHNIEIAIYMYETVVRDLERIAEEKWQEILRIRELQEQFPSLNLFTDPTLKWVHGKTWKASFYVGAVEIIRQRLEENLTDLQANNDNLMALVTTEHKQLMEFQKQQFPKTVNGKGMSYNYGAAYKSGQLAGHSIQFKKGVGAGGVYSGPHYLGDGKKK